jgi:hypothetical protein
MTCPSDRSPRQKPRAASVIKSKSPRPRCQRARCQRARRPARALPCRTSLLRTAASNSTNKYADVMSHQYHSPYISHMHYCIEYTARTDPPNFTYCLQPRCERSHLTRAPTRLHLTLSRGADLLLASRCHRRNPLLGGRERSRWCAPASAIATTLCHRRQLSIRARTRVSVQVTRMEQEGATQRSAGPCTQQVHGPADRFAAPAKEAEAKVVEKCRW